MKRVCLPHRGEKKKEKVLSKTPNCVTNLQEGVQQMQKPRKLGTIERTRGGHEADTKLCDHLD